MRGQRAHKLDIACSWSSSNWAGVHSLGPETLSLARTKENSASIRWPSDRICLRDKVLKLQICYDYRMEGVGDIRTSEKDNNKL